MNETNQRNIFSQLYGLKTVILIAENITGQNTVAKCIHYKQLNLESEYSEKDIFEFIVKTQKEILALIPKGSYEYYKCGDYEEYTDKYYHGLYFNQIKNDDIIENILNVITNHFGLNYDDEKLFAISLYNFNNACIYFKTETDMNNFLNNYYIEPCTAYKILWSS